MRGVKEGMTTINLRVHHLHGRKKKIADALTAYLQVLRGDNDDPFLERNIRKALSKLNATYTFNASPTREVLTTEALRDLLNEYHDKYRRICAIAELPYSGFSSM